jgi:hypothetical protein
MEDNYIELRDARNERAKTKKHEIKDFQEKVAFLESCGWEAKHNINNWTKQGHQDSNGYWVSYPEYSLDEAYHKCKNAHILSEKDKDLVISILDYLHSRNDATDEELDLLKRLRGY